MKVQVLALETVHSKHYHLAMVAGRENPLEGIDVILAPLAGITDSVFRRICLQYGADMVVTEMISADGLRRYPERLRSVRNLDTSDGPMALQIFGSEAECMEEAAARLSALNPRFIDINFGCPVRKVVNRSSGAAILKDLKKLSRICRAVVKGSTVPVSAKVRSGWDGTSVGKLQDIGRTIEDAGVSVITLHARSKIQAFSGKANWALIRVLKEAVSVPVVGNGDVRSADDFFTMKKETGVEAAMIGRGAVGNPWIFKEIKTRISGGTFTPPSPEEQVDVLLDHVRSSVVNLGEPLGLIAARKVMAAYVKYLPNARHLRRELMQCERLAELEQIFARNARFNNLLPRSVSAEVTAPR